jgi:hypothetical protein
MNRSTVGAIALFSLIAAVAWPGAAHAEEAIVRTPVTTETTTSEATGPSMTMVGSGVVIFGLSYIPAFIVGVSSGLDADHTLLVPLAGPWIDFGQRPGCSPATQCNTENTNKVLLATDGVFQAIGALTVVGGFLTPAHEETRSKRGVAGLTLHLSPAQVGSSGYGMLASGTF